MTVFPGSLRDLVSRADSRPIYCATSPRVSRALSSLVVETFRRNLPGTKITDARTLYRHRDDWRHRWSHECDQHGAAIIVTRADDISTKADPLDGVAGEHEISIWTALEIQHFAHAGRPVAWQAVEFPAVYWFTRFAVQPFAWMQTSRYARLIPFRQAGAFSPEIGSFL